MSETPSLTAVKADKEAADMAVKKKMLAEMKANLAWLIEYHTIDAQVIRAKFNALIANGFTEAQALELCKRP